MYTFIKSLLKADAYPHDTGEIHLVQTHISIVLLAGAYVYKIKKPVDFGFLNFSTLAKRKYYCEQELLLNRRLCPEIYLDVVPVINRDGRYFLGEQGGEVVEYAVKMIRMPEERMMGNIIAKGGLTGGMIDGIVDTLVPFYQRAEAGAAVNEFGKTDSVRTNIEENFSQSEPYVGCPSLSEAEFEKIGSYARGFLARNNIFDNRVKLGWIRDCHGDMYSANICLADRVYIFDCIEFSRRIRCCDVASDVAFLAMDLDYHGLTEMSERFVAGIVEKMKDPALYSVLNFYKCYRACVRGKIGLLTAHDPDVDDETKAAGLLQATRYFELAMRYGDDE